MPPSKAKTASVAKRRADAIKLRLAGVDFETIAERLGYASRGAASKDVCRAFDAYRAEEEAVIETWREVEGQRLDRLQAAAWPAAAKGDLKAIETVLKVIAQRSKLLGLDMPIKTEVSGPDGSAVRLTTVTGDELSRLIKAAGDPDDQNDNATDLEDTSPDDGDPDDDNT